MVGTVKAIFSLWVKKVLERYPAQIMQCFWARFAKRSVSNSVCDVKCRSVFFFIHLLQLLIEA